MLRLLLLGICGLLVVSGCTKAAPRCTAPEDNPLHHYLRGMEALETGKVDVALQKFDRSSYCEEEFSQAHSGLAITHAMMAKSQGDAGFRSVEAGRALDELKKADKFANTEEEKFDYQLARIRVATILKGEDWVRTAEGACREALDLKVDEKQLVYYQGKEAANYFMGVAYLESLQFAKARDQFQKVLDSRSNGKWHEKADRAWKKVDRIVRAMAGITVGDVGKKIAVKETVTRADLAALLVDELMIDKLFAGRVASQSQVQAMKPEFTPADMVNSPFKEEVATVMKWKVRGLEPKYDETTKAYLFKPEDPVTRGEMAFILEDVLIKLTGDSKIATAYFGQEKSPFPDVRTTSPYFNAVMNMTTRGIMEGELSGDFRVNDPVEGAEALLAIRVLKQKINIY
ncbi:S-layer homology domain-containing protein [Geomonas sp. Red875]|uniref:S-layer homology domain-containing protein n=2 Tax=Geomesophilobacter sediminis TaxID=2798584 RepID=A0A8J7LUL2_9BACT|nr:S-layer homology domain-containing protein [Geomesophilobacter sediminis]